MNYIIGVISFFILLVLIFTFWHIFLLIFIAGLIGYFICKALKKKHNTIKNDNKSINTSTTNFLNTKQDTNQENVNLVNTNNIEAISVNNDNNSHKKESMNLPTIKPNYINDDNEFIALDLETTGLDPHKNKIIEISALKFIDNELVDTFTTLVNPETHISSRITRINGITNEMVEFEPTIEDCFDELIDFIGVSTIVGHNVYFDINFLKAAYKKIYEDDDEYYFCNDIFDTVKISRKLFPNLENHKLQTIVDYLNIDVKDRHRAESDAYACAQIFILNNKVEDILKLSKQAISEYKNNNIEKAKELYEKAVYLDKNTKHLSKNKDIYEKMAILLEKKKLFNDTLLYVNDFLEFEPNNDKFLKRKFRLEQKIQRSLESDKKQHKKDIVNFTKIEAVEEIATTLECDDKVYIDENGNGLVKGNIGHSGKIYHLPGSTYYNITKAEKFFKTESEAIAAGFRSLKTRNKE